ncbi:MAG: TA system VapC family ribonuclease toxin [Thermoanaerobaculia bacterium]
MDLLDANILVGAFRADDLDHASLKAWLEEALAEDRALCLPAIVELAFVRIVTHPRIFRNPSSTEEAMGFLRALLDTGLVSEAPWTERVRARWRAWCETLGLSGDDVNDALLAATSAEGRCRLVSRDQGFARFPGLAWLNPTAPPPTKPKRGRSARRGSR